MNVFKKVNLNPKGYITGDCVIRAITNALNQDYVQTYIELFNCSLNTGYMINDDRNYSRYLTAKGFIKYPAPDNMSGVKFCRTIATPNDIIVAKIGEGHLTCIKNQCIEDIFNISELPISEYWVKSK